MGKKYFKFVPFVILIIILIGVGIWIQRPGSSSAKRTDERVTVQGPRASEVLNKEFSFSIKDDRGSEVTKLKYLLESAELRDEIIVKGQRAVAVKGRTFLILNIKLTNSYSKTVDVNAKDYIRLAVNGLNKELFAADIHNDPVEIQADSTKVTRLGFPVNDTDKKMVLYVGEINGDKKEIPLNMK